MAGAVRAGEPGAGLCVLPGQRNWPGWWWFSRTGEHVGAPDLKAAEDYWVTFKQCVSVVC
jgi:hypothetical protein